MQSQLCVSAYEPYTTVTREVKVYNLYALNTIGPRLSTEVAQEGPCIATHWIAYSTDPYLLWLDRSWFCVLRKYSLHLMFTCFLGL